MDDILDDLSRQALTFAVEANLFALIPALGRWPRAEVHEETEIAWSITDIPFPTFNSVLRARLAPSRIDATIASITGHAKSRNVPLLWWTGPTTEPATLATYLEAHGFASEGNMPGMAVVLEDLRENMSTPDGLIVQRAETSTSLRQWGDVLARGFGFPGFVGEGFRDFVSHADQDSVLPYIGLLHGEPVATSLLVLGAGVAGIYNVATVPEVRRQGIGALVTLAPLREARRMGYKAGILHSSELGMNVYRSLGFEEYCKIGQYVWLPQ